MVDSNDRNIGIGGVLLQKTDAKGTYATEVRGYQKHCVSRKKIISCSKIIRALLQISVR